jgi:hypothetical protein
MPLNYIIYLPEKGCKITAIRSSTSPWPSTTVAIVILVIPVPGSWPFGVRVNGPGRLHLAASVRLAQRHDFLVHDGLACGIDFADVGHAVCIHRDPRTGPILLVYDVQS